MPGHGGAVRPAHFPGDRQEGINGSGQDRAQEKEVENLKKGRPGQGERHHGTDPGQGQKSQKKVGGGIGPGSDGNETQSHIPANFLPTTLIQILHQQPIPEGHHAHQDGTHHSGALDPGGDRTVTGTNGAQPAAQQASGDPSQ